MNIRTRLLIIVTLVLPTSANAALISRLGGLAYYDDVANLTWLADANYSMTSGYDADGMMTWDAASAWVASLDVAGVTGWRLPDTIDVGNDGATEGGNVFQGVDSGYNITTHSELSNMFFNVLGNISQFDTVGAPTSCIISSCLTNKIPFSNLQSFTYWSGTEYAIDAGNAWIFDMRYGLQDNNLKSNTFYAWAVFSGDVSAVPVPPAVWLFGSGLIALIGVARRRR